MVLSEAENDRLAGKILTACSHAAGDKEDGGLLVYTSIKQDITKVPPLPATRVQQGVIPRLTFWIIK